ncbi:hypothetical protein [Streptomyces sp. FH025]|uniref:hypothetical protein n=1 Tax=Streptomyces sp. FH025 TaxID=2815937 RepID=UPI0027DD23C5|nr:hypothetical protein [Streptomyces sp. FH025]
MQDEDELLVEALRAIGGSGAAFTAKLLKKNVHEIDLSLPLAFEDAVLHMYRVLVTVGHQVDRQPLPKPSESRHTIRVMAGGRGVIPSNPVLVTATLTRTDPQSTAVLLRAAAKEGLIKQRSGEKTAERIAALLAQ